jgi:3-oxoadipate enol-lactonase
MTVTSFAMGEGGARIRMRVDGPAGAPAILFSHSLGVSMDTWDAQVRDLSRSFRIVRYDARGHGGSDAPSGAYSIDVLARDAVAVLDAAGVESSHVVGLSMGGMVGMWLGIHAPKRVARLVLANTTPHIPLRDMWNSRIDTALSTGMETIAGPTLTRWLGDDFKTTQPQACMAMIEAMGSMSPVGYAGCCAALRDADQRALVARIASPTLVITGSADLATTPAVAQGLADAILGARMSLVNGAGHLSNVEKEDAFNQLIGEFLG